MKGSGGRDRDGFFDASGHGIAWVEMDPAFREPQRTERASRARRVRFAAAEEHKVGEGFRMRLFDPAGKEVTEGGVMEGWIKAAGLWQKGGRRVSEIVADGIQRRQDPDARTKMATWERQERIVRIGVDGATAELLGMWRRRREAVQAEASGRGWPQMMAPGEDTIPDWNVRVAPRGEAGEGDRWKISLTGVAGRPAKEGVKLEAIRRYLRERMDAPEGLEVQLTRGMKGQSKEWTVVAKTEEAGKWIAGIGSEPEGYEGYRWGYARGWARFRAEMEGDESEPDDYTGLQGKVMRAGERGVGKATAQKPRRVTDEIMGEYRPIHRAILVMMDPAATPEAKAARWHGLNAEGRQLLRFMRGAAMTPGTAPHGEACALKADVEAMMVERREVTRRRECAAKRRARNEDFVRNVGRWKRRRTWNGSAKGAGWRRRPGRRCA